MILFLDFDGVLHSSAVRLINGSPVLLGDGVLFEFAPALDKMLAPYPGVEIVLSTSWVRVLGLEKSKAMLPDTLQRRVIGATFPSLTGSDVAKWIALTRYEQIERHVAQFGIENWLAIDDDTVGWPFDLEHRLVSADPELALGDVATQRRLKEALQIWA